jgi:hypothetical protein
MEDCSDRAAVRGQGQAGAARRLATVKDARDYVGEAMQMGRSAPWRQPWHRLKSVTTEDGAIEAIGDMRELSAYVNG